jgi:hypothetical protein
VQPHEGLLKLKSTQGIRRYMLSKYMFDPNLLVSSGGSRHSPKYGADSRLQWLYNLVSKDKDMGLIAIFGGIDELHDYTEIDGVERGESDESYHVQVINTSPVEMLLLAGQPVATAVPANYKEVDRNLHYLARSTRGRTDPLRQRMEPIVQRSLADVNRIIKHVTHCEPGDEFSRAKQMLLTRDQAGGSNTSLLWVPVHCMSKVTTVPDAVFTVSSLVGTINVQRGLLVGMLMERIQEHIISNKVDRVAGRYEVSLCLRRLMEAHPTLTVPVIADMMAREDTKDLFSELFRQELKGSTDPLSAKTDELNVETLLMIENWIANSKRIMRVTPF